MPLVQTEVPTGTSPRVTVGPSIAIELEWALAAGENAGFRQDHPTLAAVYEGDPELHRRVQAMWGPEAATSCGGFMELMVLAHRVGLILSADAPALLDRLDEACALPLDERAYPLHSKTAEDRRVILLRLSRLRRSAQLRRQYVALVRDTWEAVRGDWERYGRRALEAAIGARSEAQARGADWHEVARSSCDFGALLEQSLTALGPNGELAVVPAFFTHQGLLFDLPGVVVLGVRTDTTGVQARARTQALARRLKAISDPTRLAILDALRTGPRTVTELAAAFTLAQPTVSNHVRVLREAGLVADERDGPRRHLVVQPEAANELLAGLQGVLRSEAHTHGDGA
jgi:DNA-binding transcriptional ArsR family regulator